MYKLDKPYADKQKMDFIVEYNHKQELRIEETETALYALEDWEELNGDVVVDNREQWEQEQTKERKKAFEADFIETAWGWYRKAPKGYANAPQSIDVIFNMVNIMKGFTEQVANLMIFYTKPDFADPEQCTEEWLVANQVKHESCTLEEFMQFYVDFQTRWANELYRQAQMKNIVQVGDTEEQNIEL